MKKEARIDFKAVLVIIAMTVLGVIYISHAANTANVSVSATVTSVIIEPADIPTATVTPTEAGTTTVYFSFVVEDPAGIANIDNNSAAGNLTLNDVDRIGVCTPENGVNATAQNYSCTANINYYDNATTWTITIAGANLNGTKVTNNARTFTYSSLNAINMTPTSLSNWASSWYPGATDILSNDDPLLISQRGNTYSVNIQTTAVNLVGAVTGTEIIPAANFTINVADECNTGTAMVNATATQVANAYLPSSTPATEELYVCMEHVPAGISAQTYNSPEDWVITVS